MDWVSLNKKQLIQLYRIEGKSMRDISVLLHCSIHKISYWMDRFHIERRSKSDATYVQRNPGGNPFIVKIPTTTKQWFLFGLGLGLYWGEGTKANHNSIRLGNTDPALVRTFISFLEKTYSVPKTRLRFGLQVFSDCSPSTARNFWSKAISVRNSQFQKVIITPSRGSGTYRRKSKYGVITVYFHNKKLRDILIAELSKLGLKI